MENPQVHALKQVVAWSLQQVVAWSPQKTEVAWVSSQLMAEDRVAQQSSQPNAGGCINIRTSWVFRLG